jgi:hypothetical protein
LSRGFRTESQKITNYNKSPSAIALHYKDGVYGVDEHSDVDSPSNILMSLGKTMEKLLTMEKDQYEKLHNTSDQQESRVAIPPEAHHYSELGNFIIRSQLDAHDPRLPGTGVFDLKTRAVVAIRISVHDHEKGQGYQIKDLQGTWESYEREYHDMVRSTFLKYSLQVRMGRMDGIFVTYHNVENIFGFQYISLPEMDMAIHGQTEPYLGDQELRLSVKLVELVFDKITQIFPEQSVLVHFEARMSEAKVRDPRHRMYIFAEPTTEAELDATKKKRQEELKELRETVDALSTAVTEDDAGLRIPNPLDDGADVTLPDSLADLDTVLPSADDNDTDPVTTSQIFEAHKTAGPNRVLGFELVVRNMINGKPTLRPKQLTASCEWRVEYDLIQMPEMQARIKYAMCKNRKKKAMRQDMRENAFLRRLFRMAEQGAQWRREMKERDSARGQIVLYPDSANKESAGEEAAM